MERQLMLRLGSPTERREAAGKYLVRLGWTDREVAVLLAIAAEGEVIDVCGQEIWRWSVSVGKAARIAGCAKATWLAAVADLVNRQVMQVLPDRPQTYVVNWSRLTELLSDLPSSESDTFERRIAELLSPDWGETVSPGQARSGDRVRVEASIESVLPCNRDRVRDTGQLTETDRSDRRDQSDLPWQSFTSEDLRAAVMGRDLTPLGGLFREAVLIGWIAGDSYETRLRFLTICHHCATAPGFKQSRMGGVVQRVRRDLDVSKIRHQSEEWARCMLRRPANPKPPVPNPLRPVPMDCLPGA